MAIHNMRKKGTKVMGNNGIELERDGFKSRTGFIPVSYTHLDVYKRQV